MIDISARLFSSSALPVLVKELERILTFTYTEMTNAQWSDLAKEMSVTLDVGEASREQMVAMSSTQLLARSFAFIRRTKPTCDTQRNPLETLELMDNPTSDRNWYGTYLTTTGATPGPFVERIRSSLELSLGANLRLGPTLRAHSAVTASEPIDGARVVLVLLDVGIEDSAGSTTGNLELVEELESAIRHGLLIVPVLLPGVSVPREAMTPPPLRPMLAYTFTEIRDDPNYGDDVSRILRFCRSHTSPAPGFIGTALPDDIPLHAQILVHALVNAAHTCAS